MCIRDRHGLYQIDFRKRRSRLIREMKFHFPAADKHFFQICKNRFHGNRLQFRFFFSGNNDVQQAQRHRFQPFSFRINVIGGHDAFFFIQFMGTKHIRITDYRRQRRFQLMGKGSHKFLFRLNFLFQLFDILLKRARHAVEVLRQLTELVLAYLLCTVSVIARRHSFCPFRQKAHRLCQQRRNNLHDEHPGKQHDERYPAVKGKAHRPFRKHFRNVFHVFQIKNPVQRIHRRSGMYEILFSHVDDAVCFDVFSRLEQQFIVHLKTVARIEHVFFFIGDAQKAARALPSSFQIGSNFLYRIIRQHTVFGRNA